MKRMAFLGLAAALGAGAYGMGCSSSSSAPIGSGDDGGAAADTGGGDAAADTNELADTGADTSSNQDSASGDDGGEAGSDGGVCATDPNSQACESCLEGAATGACSNQFDTCESDTSGSDHPDAGANLSCSGILACVQQGGNAQTCADEGTTTGKEDAVALAACLRTACGASASLRGPIHVPLP